MSNKQGQDIKHLSTKTNLADPDNHFTKSKHFFYKLIFLHSVNCFMLDSDLSIQTIDLSDQMFIVKELQMFNKVKYLHYFFILLTNLHTII